MIMNKDRNWCFLGIVPENIPHHTKTHREDSTIYVAFGNLSARIGMQEGSTRDFPASMVSDFLKTALENPGEKAHQIGALQQAAAALGIPQSSAAPNTPAHRPKLIRS